MNQKTATQLVAAMVLSAVAVPVQAEPLIGPMDGPGLPSPPPLANERVDPTAPPSYWYLIPTYQDVPEYTWHYGCSPTAAGMLFAWWDAQPGTQNLFDGDASTFTGDASESPTGGTRAMVAATSHIVAGQENGYTYGDWHDCSSYPNHASNPASLGDFMKTVDGGTYRSAMATGFEAFAEWDAPWTSVNESHEAEATTYYTSSGWTFEDFKAEIGAGYPIHLGIRGHSVLALGWWDQRSLGDPGDYGYICHTTWSGWGLTQWRWDGTGVPYGMEVYGATYLNVVPEPATLALLALGGLLVARRRRRSNCSGARRNVPMRLRSAIAIVVASGLAVGGAVANGEMAYDNTVYKDYPGIWISNFGGEIGDQVTLAGTDRVITKLDIVSNVLNDDGMGDFRVRMYANDGPEGGPSSLLWETLLADYPTVGDPFCTLTVEIPNVLVPDTLTWTVNRLDYNYGVGLPHFDPPAVGSSGDFYWLFDGRDWRMRESGGPDNFGARIEAVPEPATLSLLAFGALTAIRRKR